jgi:membrane-bound lytic murein transglycosylase D
MRRLAFSTYTNVSVVTIFAVWLTGCATPGGSGQSTRTVSSEMSTEATGGLDGDLFVLPDLSGDGSGDFFSASLQNRDFWARLRDGMEMPRMQNRRLEREIRSFKQNAVWFNASLERGRLFLPHILEETRRRGMPSEVALLPVIESGFKTNARSHVGAGGVWQIMPATGRRFGLHRNDWYDARYDVLASTRAALDYLEYLNELFEGDWLLTLAAYNAGEGRVQSAQKRNRRKGRPVDFWSLDLPEETERYVPKLLAASELVARSGYHKIALPALTPRRAFMVVDAGGPLDLDVAAKLADLSTEEVIELNAAYRRHTTPRSGPHHLVLPAQNAKRLRVALADLPDSARVGKSSSRHRVKRGESLSVIARDYGISVAELRRANGLNGSRIVVGQYLHIPQPAGSTARSDTDRPVEYVVRQGDSLWKIARRFGVSHKQLANWNGLGSGDVLKPGRKLVVWT